MPATILVTTRTTKVSNQNGHTTMTRLCVYSSFSDLMPSYGKLFQVCSQQSGFFLSLPWFQNWSKTALDAQRRLRIYGLESDDAHAPVLAVLPMCYTPPALPAIQFNILHAAANYYSAQVGPVINIDETGSKENLALLIQGMIRESPRWDIMDFHPIEKGSENYALLKETLSSAGMAVECYFCSGNWFLKVGGRTYQQYFANLPSRLRNTLQRKSEQIKNAGQLRFDIISAPEQAADRMHDFLEVYANSWKKPEPFPEFMPGWIVESARQGWLRMGIASIDNKPVAAQIWVVHQNKASIYKLAYDRQYAKYSIGSLLTAHLLQQVIDTDQVAEVDFLNGDESYKQDWMSHRREYWGIVAYNRHTLKGQLSRVLQKLSRQVKRLPPH